MDESERNCAKLTAILGIDEFKPPSQFRLYDLLGPGTQGIGVFKAQDTATGKKYAAKVFQIRREFVGYAKKANTVSDDSTVLAYVREFRAIKGFRHANIVRYYFLDVSVDKFLDNYQLRVFMERCTGDTLERDMGKVYQTYKAGYKSADVHRHFLDLLSGLDCLHQRQIVHRDLRPENLILPSPKKKP
ncbi:cell division protein kinase 2 homolog CRK1-like [Paramacrobiotus metropolitanus]|uniref:cell division protein kinase 2 homolog CRK1-like n=1 Tax=Paramacrobiotus metropolitanus TaxID=2943436 RepID=UPI002445D863|nr:cell division protein kinase 2 homolog CRK1-like [Paramacrobiotus metropolitanus]